MDQSKKDNTELEEMSAKNFLQDSFFGKGAIDQFFVLCHLTLRDPQEWSRALLRDRFNLTKTEVNVLEGLCLGRTQEKIAEGLGITDRAVRNAIDSLSSKMKVRSKEATCAIGGRYGLPVKKSAVQKGVE
jgi:DNA-binding CsgD family transcriptional regulator